MSWRDHAQCIGTDGDVFFPNAPLGNIATWSAARSLCAECSVRDDCLAMALSHPINEDRWGMFGGMTPSERRIYRRRLVRES